MPRFEVSCTLEVFFSLDADSADEANSKAEEIIEDLSKKMYKAASTIEDISADSYRAVKEDSEDV